METILEILIVVLLVLLAALTVIYFVDDIRELMEKKRRRDAEYMGTVETPLDVELLAKMFHPFLNT